MHMPYARLLGLKKEKSGLLRQIKKIPVITKPADGLKMLSNDREAYALYEKDIYAADLYNRIQHGLQKGCMDINPIAGHGKMKNEYAKGPIIM